MPSCLFCSHSPITGYASMALNDSGLTKLQRYFQKIPFEVDIVGEEILPGEMSRPVWSEVLEMIEREAITTLVVPSLLHVAGDDFNSLANFLKFLRLKGARLKSLAEWTDSSRIQDREIMAVFARKYFGSDMEKVADERGAM